MGELHRKLGELLALERKRRNITADSLAADLKVPEEKLEAMESGDTSAWPSELYYNLFARTYAEALGIDYQATIDAIKEDLGELTDAPAHTDSPGAKTEKRSAGATPGKKAPEADSNGQGVSMRKLIYMLVAVIVILIAAIAAKTFFWKSDDVEPTHGEEATVAEVETAEVEETGSRLADNYDWNTPDYQPPPPMKLTLDVRGECWGAVLADGDTAIYRTLVPGKLYEVTAQHRMNVSVGVPSLVDITLNGEPMDLRSESGRIYSFDLTQINLKEIMTTYSKAAREERDAAARRQREAAAQAQRQTAPPPAPVQQPVATPSQNPSDTAATPTADEAAEEAPVQTEPIQNESVDTVPQSVDSAAGDEG